MTSAYCPTFVRAWLIWFASILYNVVNTKVDFPDPETPVTHVSVPSGKVALIFFKLLEPASKMHSSFPFPDLLCAGTGMIFFSDKY